MIGTDIIDKRRIANSLAQHGGAFARKVLHESELPQWQEHHDPVRFIAMRWAAKEALSKALGTGLRPPITMTNMSITHNDLGAPQLIVSHEIMHLLQQHGYQHIHLSLSDERHYAIAFVTLN